MNDELQAFARTRIIEGLSTCTEAEQNLFKLMYAKGKIELSIAEVVEKMDVDRLSWAMEQINRTLSKRKQP